MKRLLAVETSSAACSAALWIEGQVEERYTLVPRQHATLILPMVESLLAEADIAVTALDACAFGCGPGSFTGVRISASVIQGIAFAASLPVVPVSTLAALGRAGMRACQQPNMLAALDARKQEVYWAAYRRSDERPELLGTERVCAPDHAEIPADGDWVGVGSGWSAYGEVLAQRVGERLIRVIPDLEPRAQDVAVIAAADYRAGRSASAAGAIPVYLRNRVADEKA